MTISALDEHVALIVIDLQQGILATPTAHPTENVLGRAERLVAAFRDADLPVVLLNVAGVAPGRTDSSAPKTAPPPGWTDLVSGLNPQPADHLITKHTWGAFARNRSGKAFEGHRHLAGGHHRYRHQRRGQIDCPSRLRRRLSCGVAHRRDDRS